jgi:hypothetical protein
MLEKFDKELENFHSLVQPASESEPRTPFESPHLPAEKLSVANMSRQQFLSVLLSIMLHLIVQMRKSSKLYDGIFQPIRSEVEPQFIGDLEIMARTVGTRLLRIL